MLKKYWYIILILSLGLTAMVALLIGGAITDNKDELAELPTQISTRISSSSEEASVSATTPPVVSETVEMPLVEQTAIPTQGNPVVAGVPTGKPAATQIPTLIYVPPPSDTPEPENETFTVDVAPVVVVPPQEAAPNSVLMNFSPSASPAQRQDYIDQLTAAGAEVKVLEGVNAIVVEATSLEDLPSPEEVASIEPDYYVVAQQDSLIVSNDPRYSEQWGLQAIGAPSAWEVFPQNAPSVVVAVLDSGICAEHADLAGHILPGYDFVQDDTVPQDELGHGCGVSSIIAANIGDGIGMAGIAPNAQIMPLRVLDARGIGRYSDVAEAIVYAVDNGADIINLSLGGTNDSIVLQNAIDYAVSRDVMVIAAAGNTGGGVLFPARYSPVISAGSVDQNLQRSSFSNGPIVDVMAPGRGILVADNNNEYTFKSGTSFAAPHVAGVVALEIAFGRLPVFNQTLITVGGMPVSATVTPTIEPIVALTPETPINQLFTEADAQAALAMNGNLGVIRSRYVGINFDAVSHTGASSLSIQSVRDDKVALSLFDDVTLIAAFERVEAHELTGNGLVWIGSVEGVEGSDVILVAGDGQMEGYILLPDATYQITYAGNGVHAINEINVDTIYNLLAEPLIAENLPAENAAEPSVVPSGIAIVDFMVVYTPTVRANAGGTTAIQNMIQAAVAAANQAYLNSGVNLRLRLVHTAEIIYTEIGEGDLERLTGNGDGYMDTVHTLRNTYGADLVTLITEHGNTPTGAYCGIGWLMNVNSTSFRTNGFNIVVRSCLPTGLTLAHELGHNMGAHHDYPNAPGFVLYPYAYGYVDPQGAFRDIMSYSNNCPVNRPCTRINYFSNPNLTFAGRPLGTGSANVALVLNNTAATVASFYNPATTNVEPTPTPVSAVPTATSAVPTPQPTAVASCTISVANGNVAGLINAINTANSTPATTDTICLATNGTYTVTSGTYLNAGYNAFPAIASPINIVGNGSTIVRSSTADFRFFYIQSGELNLNGITLKNGVAQHTTNRYGGAIYNSNGNLVIAESVLDGNMAQHYGGAIFTVTAPVTIHNSTMKNNSAYGGGVITSAGNVTITDSDMQANSATLGSVIYRWFVSGGTTVTMSYNCIAGNSLATTYTESDTIIAVNNWWGSSQGPSPEGNIVSGAGDIVGANTTYTPFLLRTTPRCLPAPSAPGLVAPGNNTIINDNTPALSWQSDVNASSYHLQLATSQNFSTGLVEFNNIAAPFHTVTPALADGVYYWRVRSFNGVVYSNWSGAWSFTVDTTAPAALELISPANDAQISATSISFSWSPVATAAAYELEFNGVVYTTATTSYTAQTPPIGTYPWRVRARDAAFNWSPWSSRNLSVVSPPGVAPSRNYYTTATPLLTWNPVTWATGYEVQVDNSNTFTSPEFSSNTLGAAALSVTTTSLPNGVYYWRVRAKDANGVWGAWSIVDSFTINTAGASGSTGALTPDWVKQLPVMDYAGVSFLTAFSAHFIMRRRIRANKPQ